MTDKTATLSSNPCDTWKDRALEMCELLSKWTLYMKLSGAKPVSGDLRDNPVLALIADTQACLRKPVPSDETKCVGVKCTHCNGKGTQIQVYDEEQGWSDPGMACKTCEGSGRIRTVEQYLKTLPANWHEDSSLDTWFPLTAEEHERYKRALQTANGFLIMNNLEPVKLEYLKANELNGDAV